MCGLNTRHLRGISFLLLHMFLPYVAATVPFVLLFCNMGVEIIFSIAILVMSIVIHEVAHGVMANYLGDPTARLQGRLTLNPVPHVDILGSIIIPAFLVVSSSTFLFGWAKPVPYNPYNLRRGGRFAEALVAVAGPAVNILLAIIFGIITRVLIMSDASGGTIGLAFTGVVINVMLAVFNCIPIPPLDGSKILDALLPNALRMQYAQLRAMLEANIFLGFGIVLLFVVLFGHFLAEAVFYIARILAGV